MQLDQHLTQVHDQLSAAAALGDERTREIAAALATAANPAIRLAILHAMSAAADEITAALVDFPGSPAVALHLDGEDIHVAVRAVTPDTAAAEHRHDDGDTSARISLRLSESLKADVEDAAARDSVSVNTWLVRAATAALRPGPFGSGQFVRDAGGRQRGNHDNHRVTGWING